VAINFKFSRLFGAGFSDYFMTVCLPLGSIIVVTSSPSSKT